MHGNPWTEEELQYLKQNWPKIGSRTAENIPNHSLKSVRQRAKELGLRTENHYWSKEDEQYLHDNYGIMSIKDIAGHLGRKEQTICQHAQTIGVSIRGPVSPACWTYDMEQFLLENVYRLSDSKIAKELGISKKAVEYHRKKLGILKDTKTRELIVKDFRPSAISSRKPVSEKELEFVKKHGMDMTDAEIAKYLSRPVRTVQECRYKLGIRKSRPHKAGEAPMIGLSWVIYC